MPERCMYIGKEANKIVMQDLLFSSAYWKTH